MPSTLVYNASTGSDTLASGSGPATAKTGSSATNGAGNVVNLDGSPDLSGVSINDLIWANSATTNRHLSRITAVDDILKTVTTEDLLVLGAGVSWAIGGERKTLENDLGNRDWLDYKDGWTVQFDAGVYNTTAEIIPGEQGSDAGGWLTLMKKPGAASVPEIAHGTSSDRTVKPNIANARMILSQLHISTTSIWSGSVLVRNEAANGIVNIMNCDLEGKGASAAGFGVDGSTTTVTNVIGNYIHGNLALGIYTDRGNRENGVIQGNWVDGMSGDGIYMQAVSSFTSRTIYRNIVSNGGGVGIRVAITTSTSVVDVLSNTIYNCTDGILVVGTATSAYLNILNNIIADCSGWGINAPAGVTGDHTFTDNNAFFSNTSGEIQNAVDGDNNVTLTVDPFNDAANDDFGLNNTAGGGADCRAAAFPTAFLGM